jgi:glutamate 5-kinase
MTRDIAKNARRWVIKIGSALLTNNGAGLDRQAIDGWVEQIAQLLAQGNEVVLVSSGAIAEGMVRLGWATRPDSIHELQAAAAVGADGALFKPTKAALYALVTTQHRFCSTMTIWPVASAISMPAVLCKR